MNARRPRLRGVATIDDRPARIGKIKIGETKETQDGKLYPSKLDYMLAKDGNGNRIESFHAVFGEKPREFRAVFPSNEPDDFYWEAYRRYGSGTGLVCHGDGRQAIVEATGETIDCPCRYADGDRPQCKPTASLSLFVYDVPDLGVFQIDTGSLNSIKNIRWFLHALPGLTGGQYAGIPFRVYIEAFQAMHDGKASTAYAWKLGLLPGYTPANLRVAAQQAVDSFLVPPDVAARPMLDEAKPEDLYAGIPAAGDTYSEPPEEPDFGVPGEWAVQVAAAETFYRAATQRMTPGKRAAALLKLDEYRGVAAKSGEWQLYLDWVERQTDRFAEQAAATAQGTIL